MLVGSHASSLPRRRHVKHRPAIVDVDDDQANVSSSAITAPRSWAYDEDALQATRRPSRLDGTGYDQAKASSAGRSAGPQSPDRRRHQTHPQTRRRPASRRHINHRRGRLASSLSSSGGSSKAARPIPTLELACDGGPQALPTGPRRISPTAFGILQDSIRALGVVKPIILNADRTIVAGHQDKRR